MDTFGFTQKKLTSLSRDSQHRHMAGWLSGFYHKLTTNRVSPAALALFADQYTKILAWTGMPPFIRPASSRTREWIECISDRIHYHRSATGKIVRDHDLFEKVQTADLPAPGHRFDYNCHVALDGLRSLFNVGSIFRTCEAAGFASILLGNTLGKEHPSVRKTAMGADQWVEQERVTDLGQALLERKEKGFHIIGVETVEGSRPFDDMPWENNTIVVFGNEEYGISSHVMDTCDSFVHIPMFGRKNSINVANAAAVICFKVAGSLSGN